ncbi:MAG: enoyl-CoA hydratase/isomerase family protein [Cytophagales bacterium]|nr:enoyl-CoA hydratase/isomerase family protein [Cytophagales bacterium]
MSAIDRHVLTEVQGGIARLTLNRPSALNALSLAMIRAIATALVAWRDDASITHVLMRGMSKDRATGEFKPFGAFCAGGDIRYFHEAVYSQPSAALNRDSLEAFFTEEYTLNHLIHHYPKPVVAVMDGVIMGGGMGLTQGASTRIVTDATRMAMPETAIGLFPDVGGGYFLSRAANSAVGVGEYLALTGQMLKGSEAVALGLADVLVASKDLPTIWRDPQGFLQSSQGLSLPKSSSQEQPSGKRWANGMVAHFDFMQKHFAHSTLQAIVQSLQADDSDWAQAALAKLQKNSPLMLAVTLEQIQRARHMSLADDLRMERDMVFHSFAGTPQKHSDTVEGIRSLVIDKDHAPQWQPARVEDITPAMVNAYFVSPWQASRQGESAHPLRHLK